MSGKVFSFSRVAESDMPAANKSGNSSHDLTFAKIWQRSLQAFVGEVTIWPNFMFGRHLQPVLAVFSTREIKVELSDWKTWKDKISQKYDTISRFFVKRRSLDSCFRKIRHTHRTFDERTVTISKTRAHEKISCWVGRDSAFHSPRVAKIFLLGPSAKIKDSFSQPLLSEHKVCAGFRNVTAKPGESNRCWIGLVVKIFQTKRSCIQNWVWDPVSLQNNENCAQLRKNTSSFMRQNLWKFYDTTTIWTFLCTMHGVSTTFLLLFPSHKKFLNFLVKVRIKVCSTRV